MKQYLDGINATEEVIWWVDNVIAARRRKQVIDITEVEHILDYLVSDDAPKRLRKMSYAQALRKANEWSAASQKKGHNLVDDESDIETIHDFLDDTRIVKLISRKAYQREGYFMAHCVGNYDPSSTTIYSYRDAKNQPHATFEVSTRDGAISQIKGKGNGPIHPKYIHPIMAFLQAIGKPVGRHDMRYLGYIYVSPEMQNMIQQFSYRDGSKQQIISLFGDSYVSTQR